MRVCPPFVLIAGLVVLGCEPNAPAPVAPLATEDLPVVALAKPERTSLTRTTTQPATLHPYFEARLYARVAGNLAELRRDIGAEVAAGDVLAVIDVPELDKAEARQLQRIERLKAEQGRAEAGVELAKADVKAAEAALASAEAAVSGARAKLRADQAEFTRVTDLVSSRSVEARLGDEARERFESSQAAVVAAEANVTAAEATITLAEARRSAAEADLATAEATVVEASKELEEMQAILAFAHITAPFAGVITERNVDPGDLVRKIENSSGSPTKPLFVVAQIDLLRVRVVIPESDAVWADVGDTVALALRARPDLAQIHQIKRIARGLDPSTRTMLLEFDVDNPEGDLIPGMYGEATITLEERTEVLTLPNRAVRYDATGGAFVFTLGSSNTLKRVPVTVGVSQGDRTEIVAGLDEDDRVVAPTGVPLQEGQRVRVEGEGQ